MSEMIKRAAEAMAAIEIKGDSLPSHDEYVRVVIESLRNPSIALLNKLEDLLDTHGREQPVEDSWSDLIDAVLK